MRCAQAWEKVAWLRKTWMLALKEVQVSVHSSSKELARRRAAFGIRGSTALSAP
jgi:hypothetical protein